MFSLVFFMDRLGFRKSFLPFCACVSKLIGSLGDSVQHHGNVVCLLIVELV